MSYTRLPSPDGASEGSDEPLIKEAAVEEANNQESVYDRTPRCTKLLFVTSIILLCLSGILFMAALTMNNRLTEKECVNDLSLYSPMLEAVEYSTFSFNNSFAQPSKFRGPPTEELEGEWDKLWNYRDIPVPADKLHTLTIGQPEDTVWQTLPVEVGGGYAAGIEVFHQLHCLNMIRQYTWGTYYARHGLTVPMSLRSGPMGNRMHVDHCIETLRMTLMCHGDTTPMLREVDSSAPLGIRAKFSNLHKCVNFDNLKDWMAQHQVGKGRSLQEATKEAYGHEHETHGDNL